MPFPPLTLLFLRNVVSGFSASYFLQMGAMSSYCRGGEAGRPCSCTNITAWGRVWAGAPLNTALMLWGLGGLCGAKEGCASLENVFFNAEKG